METSDISERFALLEYEGQQELAAERVPTEHVNFERAIDFRYHGQEYVLTIPVPNGSLDMAAVRQAFDGAYLRQYGHNNPEARVEMANIRVVALGKLDRPPLPGPGPAEPAPVRRRRVYFSGEALPTSIVQRSAIGSDTTVFGPAIIEEGTATTLVPPGWQASTLASGHLLLSRDKR